MSKKAKDLGTIDLTNMNKRQSHALYLFSKKHVSEDKFKKNTEFKIYDKKTKTEYTFKLSHRMLHDIQAEKLSDNIYSVRENHKLGSGAFGSIKKSLLELRPNSKKERFDVIETPDVIYKKIKQDEDDTDEKHAKYVNNETSLAYKTPHLDISRHVFFKHPKDNLYRNYLRMKFFEGQTLYDFFQETKTVEDVLTVMINMARALRWQYHKYGIIHRDIKPENIIISPHHEAYIIDVGLAKRRGEKVFEGVGTYGYASPEQCNRKFTKPASDVYALGVTFKEFWRKAADNSELNEEIFALCDKMQRKKWRPSLDSIIKKLEKIQLKYELSQHQKNEHKKVKAEYRFTVKTKDHYEKVTKRKMKTRNEESHEPPLMRL